MKSIVVHDADVVLPKCMYTVRNRTDFPQEDDVNLNISNQVIKFLKGSTNMTELEERQDELLQKLDILYERIKNIGSHCNIETVKISASHVGSTGSTNMTKLEQRQNLLLQKLDILHERIQNISSQCNIQAVKTSGAQVGNILSETKEIVIVVSPDSLPWYLNSILKQPSLSVNMSWHVHSSVPNDDVPKIMKFVNMLPTLKKDSTINTRLIFKCVSADTELKLSPLAVPIVGHVNILRYLSFVYPKIVPYDHNNHQMDHLLDICHMLERTSEKNKEALVTKLFSQKGDWLYAKEFSIVDLAAYNVFKQWKNIPQYVPKPWFIKCEKKFL